MDDRSGLDLSAAQRESLAAWEHEAAAVFAEPVTASELDASVADLVDAVLPPSATPVAAAVPWATLTIGGLLVLVAAAGLWLGSTSRPTDTQPEPIHTQAPEPSRAKTIVLPAQTPDPSPSPSPSPKGEELQPQPPPQTDARPSKSPPPSAQELLRRANDNRRAGHHARAKQGYEKVNRAYPGSRESTIARVSLGKLELEHFHNPSGALRHFSRYLELAPQGTLAQEALWGKAKALQQLARPGDERAAWSELLRRFPNSVHADLAKARLERGSASAN